MITSLIVTAASLQFLSPFIYKATQKLLDSSFKDEANALPTRMREKPALYEVRLRHIPAVTVYPCFVSESDVLVFAAYILCMD